MIISFASLQSSGKTIFSFLLAQYLTELGYQVKLYDMTDKKNLKRLDSFDSKSAKIISVDSLIDLDYMQDFFDLIKVRDEKTIHIFDTASIVHNTYIDLYRLSNALVVPVQIKEEYLHDNIMFSIIRKKTGIYTKVYYLVTNSEKILDDSQLFKELKKSGTLIKNIIKQSRSISHKGLEPVSINPQTKEIIAPAFDELIKNLNLNI